MQTRLLLDMVATRMLDWPGEGRPDMAAIELAYLHVLQMLSDIADFDGLMCVNPTWARTQPGQDTYALPPDFGRFPLPTDDEDTGIFLDQGGRLDGLRYRNPLALYRERQIGEGRPQWYTLAPGHQCTLNPTPDTEYALMLVYMRAITVALLDEIVPIDHPALLLPLILAQLAEDQGHPLAPSFTQQAQQAREQLLLTLQRQEPRAPASHPLVDMLALRATDAGLIEPTRGRADLSGLERRLLYVLQRLTQQTDFDSLLVTDSAMVITQAGVERYPLPAKFGRCVNAADDAEAGVEIRDDATHRPLRYRDPHQWLRAQQDVQGMPTVFTITYDRYLVLSPIPDRAYTIAATYVPVLTQEIFRAPTFPLSQPEYLIDMVLGLLAQERGHPAAAYFGQQAEQAQAQLLAANVRQRPRLTSTHPLVDMIALRAQTMGLVDADTGKVDLAGIQRRILSQVQQLAHLHDFDGLTVIDERMFQTSIGQRTYALPQPFSRFVSQADDASSGLWLQTALGARLALRYRDPQQFIVEQTSTAGVPTTFTVLENRQLALDPPPALDTYVGLGIYIRIVDEHIFEGSFPLSHSEYLVGAVLAELAQDRGHPAAGTLRQPAAEALGQLILANRTQRPRLASENPLVNMLAVRAQDAGLLDPIAGRVDLGSLTQRLIQCIEELTDTYDLWPVTVVDDAWETTVANQRDYSLPADFKRLINPRDADESGLLLEDGERVTPLRYRSPWVFEHEKTETAGRPTYFTMTDAGVILDPPPDTNGGSQYTLQLVYIRHVTVTTIAADAVRFPTASLIDMALGMYAVDTGHARAAVFMQAGEQARSRLLNQAARARQKFQPYTGRLRTASRQAVPLR